MKFERRIIFASFLTGVTDVVFGLFMHFTGWQEWYYSNFHNFGIFGLSMMVYAFWHYILMRRDKTERPE